MTAPQSTTETTEPTAPEGEQAAPDALDTEPQDQPEGDTFPRAYVEELRTENRERRMAAEEATGRADALAGRLHAALVAATGKLADPSDLPFDAAHLDDDAALTEAIDELLARKPHLAARRVAGDVGQGARGGAESVDLIGLMRSRA
ncbi:hypothetical protein [Tsukamurella spumae]|uniref:Uncharacterized protein n=1 Tax=Tsukamurella spumae TaxID=44753 RepID=A0A846WX80_9ACTN|nr:hypothetical protein [Tsukamurella spumae]NKY17807.1 hypothetical protein [Tsukamurella spumae]